MNVRPLMKLCRIGSGITLALLLTHTAQAQTARAQSDQLPQADNEYQTGAVLWQQSGAEVRALQYQAFFLARLMLDRDLRARGVVNKKRAVVVDVDETVLDNSRYQAGSIIRRQGFTAAGWTDWCNRAQASAIPGAVDFLKYAASRGVRVFYVTNRREPEKNGTITNLKHEGFPGVSDETVLVRMDVSSKELRRQMISKRYRVVLLCGDNLADFSNLFEGRTAAERAAAVEKARQEFGTQFIVLPNPMYGDWENVIYGPGQLSEAEKAARRKSALKVD